MIGIDGMSGSGKSGFARRLAAELGASVLGVDDLVPGWDALAESVSLLTEWVNALQTDADTRGRAGLVVARLRPP